MRTGNLAWNNSSSKEYNLKVPSKSSCFVSQIVHDRTRLGVASYQTLGLSSLFSERCTSKPMALFHSRCRKITEIFGFPVNTLEKKWTDETDVNRESGTVRQRYTELREVIKDCNDPLQRMTLFAFLSLYSDSCGILNKTCEAMCAAVCSQVLRFYCEEKNSLSPESL